MATRNSWNNEVLDANVILNGGTINIGSDNTDNAINVGTSANSGRVTSIGNGTGTSSLVLAAGSTGMTLDASGVLEVNSSGGVISIGNDDIDQNINIGTDGVRTVTVGSTNGAAATVVRSGSGTVSITTGASNANIALTPNGTGVIDASSNDIYSTGISFDSGTNTLDFYETGTWTPTVAFGGASVGITYGTQSGNYTRIGNVVIANLRISLTNKGSSTGAAFILGLPYPPAVSVLNSFVPALENVTLSGVYAACRATTASALQMLHIKSGAFSSSITNADFANNSAVNSSFTYLV